MAARHSGQARGDSNPQLPVLETGTLPIELLAFQRFMLTGFAMQSMFTAKPAEFFYLQFLGSAFFIPGGRIIAPFALTTSQRNDFSDHDSTRSPMPNSKATQAPTPPPAHLQLKL